MQHPAWLAYPNIQSFELDPRLPIYVGFWDGTTTGVAPNANPLHNSGIISDLLRLTDNPKRLNSIQTQLPNSKSSKTIGPILRMAITLHIRPIGDDSEDEDNNIQLRIMQEDNSSPSTPHSLPLKLLQSPSIQQPQFNTQTTILDRPILNPQSRDFNSNTQPLSPTGSTTEEDTSPQSYLPASHISSSSLSNTLSRLNSLPSERPPTPTTHLSPQSTLVRKRSSALRSPEQISIQTTRELRRKASSKNTSAISAFVIGDSSKSTTSIT